MEITKREVILSIAIVGFMLIIGFIISNKISDSVTDQNEVYNKAIKIEDKELFEYGMRTNVGNAFVYGDLVAIDPVSYPEIKGNYLYLKKVKEVYTKHTREVSYTCGKDTCYRTETYWTWDVVGSEYQKSEKIKFLGNEFDFKQFNLPSSEYLGMVKGGVHTRYKYYGIPNRLKGTIFAHLKDNDIGDKVPIFESMTVGETYNHLVSSKGGLLMFWLLWMVLTGFIVYGFCYLENKWLY